jgi:hypothetical protein
MTRGICYGTATSSENGKAVGDGPRYCVDSFGLGPALNRVNGDTPAEFYLRDEKVVYYQPLKGFMGPDFFTYRIWDGVNHQTHSTRNSMTTSINEVTLHTRKCRRFIADRLYGASKAVAASSFRFVNPLCDCAQSETATVGDKGKCDTARLAVCAAKEFSNSTSGFRQRYNSMCLACESTSRGLNSAECTAETMRAVSLLTARGLCSSEPSMDCTTEVITKNGLDRFEYLSLAPPTTDEAFTSLSTDAMGGGGYYRSAPKN